MSMPPERKSWAGPAAEGALVLAVVGLLFVAALAGFLVGRGSADDDDSPAAAETQTTAETTGEGATTEAATTEAATTEATETEGGEDADGAAVFASAGCGGCHTFGPANSKGNVGPKLDGIDLSKDEIEQQVRNGGGGMPPFGDSLSDAEIAAVADYVENG
jgi:mono/diheme cytochrome c family protein